MVHFLAILDVGWSFELASERDDRAANDLGDCGMRIAFLVIDRNQRCKAFCGHVGNALRVVHQVHSERRHPERGLAASCSSRALICMPTTPRGNVTRNWHPGHADRVAYGTISGIRHLTTATIGQLLSAVNRLPWHPLFYRATS